MSLQKLYEQYAAKGLVVLGWNQSDDAKIAREYLMENHVTFPTILDSSKTVQTVMNGYQTLPGYSAVPLTYVIDREGKVVDAWYGYDKERMDRVVAKLGL